MLKWILTLCAAIVAAVAAMQANAADLIVTVDGVRNGEGDIRFALYDQPEEFPTGKKLRGQEENAKTGEVTTIFKDLAPGTYGVAVHHDENSDDEMNFRLFVFPLEGYGFSNNARVVFAPPIFDIAAFTLGARSMAISLTLVY